MPWIIGAAALGSAVIGSGAASSAANTQANAANNAAQTNLNEFNTLNGQGAPYRQSGQNALSAINAGFGAPNSQLAPLTQQNFTDIQNAPGFNSVQTDPNWANEAYQNYLGGAYGGDTATALQSLQHNITSSGINGVDVNSIIQPQSESSQSGVPNGYFTHQFDNSDLNAQLAPNYAFQLGQGLGAEKNADNLQSGLVSGNTLKGINDFAQNYAGNAYQNALSNYTGQQSNIFNRLSAIAGLGQTANQTSATSGTALAGNVGQAQQNAGTAAAGGVVGGANAISSGLNNAASWYATQNNPGYSGYTPAQINSASSNMNQALDDLP